MNAPPFVPPWGHTVPAGSDDDDDGFPWAESSAEGFVGSDPQQLRYGMLVTDAMVTPDGRLFVYTKPIMGGGHEVGIDADRYLGQDLLGLILEDDREGHRSLLAGQVSEYRAKLSAAQRRTLDRVLRMARGRDMRIV